MIFGWRLHQLVTGGLGLDLGSGRAEVLSSSSMICSTRLPRTTESSTTKRSVGVYFRTTDLADQALDARAVFGEQREAALLLVGVAQDADEDGGGLQVAGARPRR